MTTTDQNTLADRLEELRTRARHSGCATEAEVKHVPMMLKALEQIATGGIAGEPMNYRDTVEIMRGIARETLRDVFHASSQETGHEK